MVGLGRVGALEFEFVEEGVHGLFGGAHGRGGGAPREVPSAELFEVGELCRAAVATARLTGRAEEVEVMANEPHHAVGDESLEEVGAVGVVFGGAEGLAHIVEQRRCEEFGVLGLAARVGEHLQRVIERVALGMIPRVLRDAIEGAKHVEEVVVHGVVGEGECVGPHPRARSHPPARCEIALPWSADARYLPRVSDLRDSCLRAMTDDGGFRVMTARTTETVQGVIDRQGAEGDTARWLADLVTGTILVRETMSPAYRVQGIIHGVGRSGRLLADAHPDGGTRGLVQRGEASDPVVGAGAVLELMRTLPRGSVQKGMVSVPDQGGLSSAFMAYLQESEQVVSMIAVSTVMEGSKVRAAGGYLVQLLPELSESMLAIMTARLDDLPSIETMLRDEATTPQTIMGELLYAMPHTHLADSPLGFQCRCDSVRLMASLATLPRHEVMEMVNDGKVIEIQCDYCREEYRIEPEQLRGLLSNS